LNRQEGSLSAGNRKPKFFYGYIVVLAGFLILAVMWGVMQSFGVFLKPMSAEFGWARAEISGAYSMSMFTLGLLFMVTGRLNDRFGPRIMLTTCGFSLGLGYLLMSQINAVWQLYLFYGVFLAIGNSGGLVPLSSTIARWFVKKRGLMTAIVQSGIGAGAMIGPPVANQLISNYGWRTSYLIMGIVALALIMVAAQFLRRDPTQKGLFPYGTVEAETETLNSKAKGTSLSQATPTRQFWILGFMYLCFGFGIAAIMVHIVPHATDLGIPPLTAATVLTIIGGLNIVGRIGVGSASDRIGKRPSLIISFILLTIAFCWLLVTKELWMFRLFAVILGISFGAGAVLMSPAVAELFGLKEHGAILGTITFGLAIGNAAGPVVTGYIFDITNSYYMAFLISAILSVTGFLLALTLRFPRKGRLMGEL